ncbi:hypothetical protein L596_029135 [Steinernema carpocapsae]|uniref:Major facilitator superfamily (MFS) profile domain-containing protein n=1 Tax=Steinernema carpocapsae TaxID=34508 RepID=A0A4U5LTR5_STECR|nr:hypothetical protein L596_029135 [Steinernema carpocapsae]
MAFGYLACGAVPITWGGQAKGLFVSILTCSYQLGPFMAMLTSGYFCISPYGWQAVYYLYGGLTTISCIFFFALYSNVPHKHMLAARNKVNPLPDSRSFKAKKAKTPYGRMITCPSIWVLCPRLWEMQSDTKSSLSTVQFMSIQF